MIARPRPIAFPEYLYLSNNHYKAGWSWNTFRRLKNVIVVMEWIPDWSDLNLRGKAKNTVSQSAAHHSQHAYTWMDGVAS